MASAVASSTRASRVSTTGWRYRLTVLSRLLAGIGLGYVLSALSAAALSLFLPMPRPEAVITGTLVSFVVFACAVLWSFAARSVWTAWVALATPSALLGVVLWWAQRTGGAA
nr:iron transporter [Variovorax boronicumulans]